MVPGSVVAKAVARWPEIARTGGLQHVKSGVRRDRFQRQFGFRIASFRAAIGHVSQHLPPIVPTRFGKIPTTRLERRQAGADRQDA